MVIAKTNHSKTKPLEIELQNDQYSIVFGIPMFSIQALTV